MAAQGSAEGPQARSSPSGLSFLRSFDSATHSSIGTPDAAANRRSVSSRGTLTHVITAIEIHDRDAADCPQFKRSGRGAEGEGTWIPPGVRPKLRAA